MSSVYYPERNLFEENMALRCEIKALTHKVEEFKSGARYLMLQEDYRSVERGYIREIKKLKAKLAAAHAQCVDIRNQWMEINDHLWQEHQKEVQKKDDAIRKLEDKLWEEQIKNDQKIRCLKQKHEDMIYEKDCIIEALKSELAHANALFENGIIEMHALKRLCEGNPYTVEEIFSTG